MVMACVMWRLTNSLSSISPHGKLATLTAVKMVQDKGVLDITKDQAVRAFREKNASDGAPINAGYMVLQPEVLTC